MKRRLSLYLCFPAFLFTLKSQTNIDSLRKEIASAKHDSVRVTALVGLSKIELKSGNIDSARVLSEKALLLSEKIKFTRGIAISAYNLGNALSDQGLELQAIEKYKTAMTHFAILKDYKTKGAALNNIGYTFNRLGNYPEALRHHFLALKIYDQLKDEKGRAISMNNIGNVYSYLANYAEALNYCKQALDIRLKLGLNKELARSYLNMGIIYRETRHLDSAMRLYKLALHHSELGNDLQGIASARNNIATIYTDKKDHAEALKQYFAAIAIEEKYGFHIGLAGSYINIAWCFIYMKKYAEAQKYLKLGMGLASKMNAREWLKNCNSAMAVCDSASGDWKNALLHFKKEKELEDSIFNEENTKKNVQQQMQYEFDKKYVADSIKNAEAKKLEEMNHQSQIRNQKLYTYAGLGGFLIMIVIAAISFMAFRNKRKTNFEIARQKLIVEMKQKEVLDSIYYARRIQRALITNETYIERKWGALKK